LELFGDDGMRVAGLLVRCPSAKVDLQTAAGEKVACAGRCGAQHFGLSLAPAPMH
jgi:hypothetical protein